MKKFHPEGVWRCTWCNLIWDRDENSSEPPPILFRYTVDGEVKEFPDPQPALSARTENDRYHNMQNSYNRVCYSVGHKAWRRVEA